VNANLVPAGADQLPMFEQTNEIVRSFNRIYGPIFNEVEALVPENGRRLPGTNGLEKMSKSLNNAIYLADEPDVIRQKVMGMYTDPNHLKVSDPGNVENNPVFAYLDVFGTDKATIQGMKEHYARGGLGDVTVKKYLNDVLTEFLRPIRERRATFEGNNDHLKAVLVAGTAKTRGVAEQTMKKVKAAIGINYLG